MKPKHLKAPFKWDDRRSLLQNGVLYAPRYYDRHDAAILPPFESGAKVFVEFCSGHGHWIVEKARSHPDCFWVAVEVQFERVRKIWSKIQNAGLSNLLVVCGEAETFVQHYLRDGSIDGVYVNFPDPWPKTKHAKHRLIQPPFVGELFRVLKQGAGAVLVTDDAPYAEQMAHTFLSSSHWESAHPEPFYATDWPAYGNSFFEQLWREKGREIRYLEFKRM